MDSYCRYGEENQGIREQVPEDAALDLAQKNIKPMTL